MLPTGFWFPGRGGTSLPRRHTSVPGADADTQQTQAARETHHAFTHVTEQSRPESQARIREEGDSPDHQASEHGRKKEARQI